MLRKRSGDAIVLQLLGKVTMEGVQAVGVTMQLQLAHMRTLLMASDLFSQYFSERVPFEQTSKDLFWNNIHVYFCFHLLHFICGWSNTVLIGS